MKKTMYSMVRFFANKDGDIYSSEMTAGIPLQTDEKFFEDRYEQWESLGLKKMRKHKDKFGVKNVIFSLTGDIVVMKRIDKKSLSGNLTTRDKLLYYDKRIDDKKLSTGQREYAKKRLKELRGNI